MSETLLIAGAGRLGSAALEVLAMRFPEWRFIVVSRDSASASMQLNLIRYVLAQWNTFPNIQHVACDLRDSSMFAEVVDETKPSIIFNATTPFPWWQIDNLPDGLGATAHAAGPGMWAALDLLLPLSIVDGLQKSTFDGIFVNGCYPDMTNAFLRDHAHAPEVGIGNLSNLIPGLRLSYAHEWDIDARDIAVRLVAHHYTSLNGPSLSGGENVPFFLEITSGSRRQVIVGPNAEPFEILARRAPRTRGVAGQGVTANSAATVLAALMARRELSAHCPGPLGLPGGYPVKIANRSVTLNLPDELDVAAAVGINEEAQRHDGIAWVGAGEVRLTEEAIQAQEQVLGYSFPQVTSENVVEIAEQTISTLWNRYHLGYAHGKNLRTSSV